MRLGRASDVIDAYASYLYYGERDYLGAFGQ